jgi:hypothetical protein
MCEYEATGEEETVYDMKAMAGWGRLWVVSIDDMVVQ